MRLAFAAALLAFSAAAPAYARTEAGPGPVARAALATPDGQVHGDVTIEQVRDMLHVTATVHGLAPGVHGIHIHTVGKCEAPAFQSAGGHWNPSGHMHGRDNPQGAHAGDLPNITVGADGSGSLEFNIPGASLTGGANPLLDADGAAVVVHAAADDYKTDPSGKSGGRIACGVVQKLGN